MQCRNCCLHNVLQRILQPIHADTAPMTRPYPASVVGPSRFVASQHWADLHSAIAQVVVRVWASVLAGQRTSSAEDRNTLERRSGDARLGAAASTRHCRYHVAACWAPNAISLGFTATCAALIGRLTGTESGIFTRILAQFGEGVHPHTSPQSTEGNRLFAPLADDPGARHAGSGLRCGAR